MSRKSLSALLRFLLPFRRQIGILSLLSLFSSSFLLAGPAISRLFIDNAFLKRNLGSFLNLSFWGIIVFIFSALAKLSAEIVKNRIELKLKLDLANKFIRKLYSLDLDFFQFKSAGENSYRFFDLENVVHFIVEDCPGLAADSLKLPLIMVIALGVNPRMTLLLVILSPLFLLRSLYLKNKLRVVYEEIWRASAALAKEINEAFCGILIIKALGLESFRRRSHLKHLLESLRWRIRGFRWSIISGLSSSFLSQAMYGAISLYGGYLIIKGRISLGSYTAAMLYLVQLGGLLQSLSQRFEYLAREGVSLRRFFEIMDNQPRIKDLPGARILESLKGEIRFKEVWFGYQKERPILQGCNFIIPASSWIAIAGPSGCGKTTLVNLLLRLYEPLQGEIILAGEDLRRIKLESLREKIAVATQQPLLFDVSVGENIAYGLSKISQEEIVEAAKIARIHDFIQQLPRGYATLIGEDGCRLSGGIKQRIALARTILRKPDLLILDEATSSVDSWTEGEIFRALRQRREGLSTIVISHRLSSIKEAERIYFLRDGAGIEEGTHSRLLCQSPLYRDFFSNQFQD